MRMRSLRLFLFLLLVVTIPVLLFGTGSSRADGRGNQDNGRGNQTKGEHQAAVRLLKIIPVPGRALGNNTAGGLYSLISAG